MSQDTPGEYLDLAGRQDSVLWSMSPYGVITSISANVEQMRGFTADEAMVQTGDQIHPPASLAVSLAYFERFVAAVLANRVPVAFSGDLEYYCKDGSTVWCTTVAFPVVDDAGVVVELRGVSAYRDEPPDSHPSR